MTLCFIGEEFAAGFDVMDYYRIGAQPALIYQRVFAQGVQETIFLCALFLRKLKRAKFS